MRHRQRTGRGLQQVEGQHRAWAGKDNRHSCLVRKTILFFENRAIFSPSGVLVSPTGGMRTEKTWAVFKLSRSQDRPKT